jgi:hypothetical protein
MEFVAGEDQAQVDRASKLYEKARAARLAARLERVRAEAMLHDVRVAANRLEAARHQAEVVWQLWQSGQLRSLQYSAHARLRARLDSMPVIEQAKGILMAESNWTADQAFDALRRASQRSNVRVRDIAVGIVANTARSARSSARQSSHPPRTVDPTVVRKLQERSQRQVGRRASRRIGR